MNDNSILNRIINLRESKDWSQAELARRIGLDKSVMNKIENGSRKIQSEELIKLSQLFEVPVDYLLNGDEGYIKKWNDSFHIPDESKKYFNLNENEKKDIAIQADKLLEGIETGDSLNFYGEPATEEQKERIRVALRTAMEMNKEEAKKKFTRKDYRN